MTIKLVSIGLRDHMDLSIRGLKEARGSDRVYLENYTMMLDATSEQLEEAIGKPVTRLSRGSLEENASHILQEAACKDVAVLVGGDALTATTHISLLVEAKKKGVETRVIHGASVLTAVAETGLSIYKFGRTVTVPLPEKGPVDTVIRTLRENREHGMHTLLLLDLDVPAGRYLTVPEALSLLMDTGEFPSSTLSVGMARLGGEGQVVKADEASRLIEYEWGDPPHALAVPGHLHFVEEEALKILADCPPGLTEGRLVKGELERLIDKYGESCRRALDTLELKPFPVAVNEEIVGEVLDHVERYLSDAYYYRGENNAVALTGVAYAEGIMDALKLLGLADFHW